MHKTSNIALLFIFLLAFVVRVVDLNTFLTLDEYLWLERSRDFLLALQTQDWARTFETGHPGVTTMWSGSLGLYAYGYRHGFIQDDTFVAFLTSLSWDRQPTDLHAYVVWPIALTTALSVVGIALLLTVAFNTRVAYLTGVLLALNPWHIGHSRVLHHDALMATFMTLSALALLIYTQHKPAPWLLVCSGICGGLAMLSKALALFLFPWMGLLFLLALFQRRTTLTQAMPDAFVWILSLGITFFVLWPAMWLNPVKTLRRMAQWATTYAINPHEKGQFFLGQRVTDPGPIFYPIVALFAISPIEMVSLGVNLIRSIQRTTKKPRSGSHSLKYRLLTLAKHPVLLPTVYVVAYGVAISLGEKKQERYLLPSLMMITIIAALSIQGMNFRIKLGSHLHISQRMPSLRMLTIIILVTQGSITLHYHPYYLTYYNPLLGGNQVAAKLLLTGWGEGNAQAAHYLNQSLDSRQVAVVATTPTAFAPYFEGHTTLWWPKAQVFAADYAVLSRQEVQQGYPDANLITHIQETWPLEKTVQLHGLPYVWIYRAPAADWTLGVDEIGGELDQAGLLAYRVEPTALPPGQLLTVTLYRQQRTEDELWLVNAGRLGGPTTPMSRVRRIYVTSRKNGMLEPGAVVEEVYRVVNNTSLTSDALHLEIGVRHTDDRSTRWLHLPIDMD